MLETFFVFQNFANILFCIVWMQHVGPASKVQSSLAHFIELLSGWRLISAVCLYAYLEIMYWSYTFWMEYMQASAPKNSIGQLQGGEQPPECKQQWCHSFHVLVFPSSGEQPPECEVAVKPWCSHGFCPQDQTTVINIKGDHGLHGGDV